MADQVQEVDDPRYAKWALLAAGRKVDVADGEILCGFFEYRVKAAGKTTRTPVQVYPTDDHGIVACIGTEATHKLAVGDDVTFISKALYARPLAYERWLQAYEGRGWWDEAQVPEPKAVETVQPAGFVPFADAEMNAALEADGKKLRQLTGEDHGPWSLPPPGHNRPPPAPGDEKLDEVATELEALEGLADGLLALSADKWTDESANQAGNLKPRITAVATLQESLYKIEVAPKDEEVKKVRGRWFPLRDRITVLKERLGSGLDRYLALEKKRRDDAARAAIKAGAAIEEVAPQKVALGGAGGRKVTPRKVRVGKILDPKKFGEFCLEQPGGKDFLQKMADKYAHDNIPGVGEGGIIPGFKIEIEETMV